MDGFLPGIVTAIWLGILTSASPCPLATNIAAISYIGRTVASPGKVFLTGLLYSLGRMTTYVSLSIFLIAGALSIPAVSQVLQKYMNQILGPVLVLTGMVLLDLIEVRIPGSGLGARLQSRAEHWGIWGAGLLGIIFALTFCPASAALFFGSLIPLSLKWRSAFLLPSLYGIGTALPVLLFALLIALGAKSISAVFSKVTEFEIWGRKVTGWVFILVGIYFCLVYVFGVRL